MQTVLLLENDAMAKYGPLGGNIDVDRYRHCIRDAQKTELQPIIGEDLYNKFMVDFSGETMTGLYLEMYQDFIFDFLVHKATEFYLAVGAYQISNAGITKSSSEDTQTINKEEVDYIVFHQRTLANNYRRQLEKFLKKNKSSIPEYESFTLDCSCKGSGTNVFGIYLSDNTRYNRF